MSTRYKAIITTNVKNEEILEAENLFPNMPTADAIKALFGQIFWEQTGMTYEQYGSLVEIVEVH